LYSIRAKSPRPVKEVTSISQKHPPETLALLYALGALDLDGMQIG